jgi:hypothetical protein
LPRISQYTGPPPANSTRPHAEASAQAPARAAALGDLRALDIERYGHEALGTTLITCDRKLARSPGIASRIALVS